MEKDDSQDRLDIICFSDVFWDSIWQRHHNILTRLPRGWRILYLEPTSLAVLLKEPWRLFSRRHNNIIIGSLPSIPLIDRLSILRNINDFFIRLWLLLIASKYGIKNPVLLFYEPRYSRLIGKLREKLVVYDCIDDKLAFPNVPGWMEHYVYHLIDRADLVFATHISLLERISKIRTRPACLISNGVDAELFSKARDKHPVPKDMRGLKGPVIGYIGAIDTWLDFGLIELLSSRFPESSIVLIGPVSKTCEKDVQKLKGASNIRFLGKKPYEELPQYLYSIDICIIPFKINDLTKCVDPIKVYEYMAAGKQIVATGLPSLAAYGSIINISENYNGFVNNVEKIITSGMLPEDYSEIVNNNTWDKKAAEFFNCIKNMILSR